MQRTTNQRTVSLGVVMVLTGALAMWLSWRYFVDTLEGQLLDDAAMTGSEIGRSRLWEIVEPVLDVIDVAFVVLVVGAAVAVAVARRRWLLAVHVAVLVGGANLTTQILKHSVLERPSLIDSIDNSLPSGHTTVAASAAAVMVLVVPRRVKPVVAVLGAGYTALTGVSTMIGGWHRPSDVVAAIAVVLFWAGVAVLFGAEQAPDRASTSERTAAATVIGLLAAVAAVSAVAATVALLRTRDLLDSTGAVSDRADLLTAYVGGALGVVAATAVLFAFMVAAGIVAARPNVAGF